MGPRLLHEYSPHCSICYLWPSLTNEPPNDCDKRVFCQCDNDDQPRPPSRRLNCHLSHAMIPCVSRAFIMCILFIPETTRFYCFPIFSHFDCSRIIISSCCCYSTIQDAICGMNGTLCVWLISKPFVCWGHGPWCSAWMYVVGDADDGKGNKDS